MLNGRFLSGVADEKKTRWHDGEEDPGFYHYDGGGGDKYWGLITRYGSESDPSGFPNEERACLDIERG